MTTRVLFFCTANTCRSPSAGRHASAGQQLSAEMEVTDPFGRGPDAAAGAAARMTAMLDSLLPGLVHTTPSEEALTHG